MSRTESLLPKNTSPFNKGGIIHHSGGIGCETTRVIQPDGTEVIVGGAPITEEQKSRFLKFANLFPDSWQSYFFPSLRGRSQPDTPLEESLD